MSTVHTFFGKEYPDTRLERFWCKVSCTDTCWLWTGARNSDGYGVFAWDSTRRATRLVYAHRASLRFVDRLDLDSPITIDHLCLVPLCVRPDHLELVSSSENARRQNQRMGYGGPNCPRGHPISLRVHKGGRVQRYCPICKSEYNRQYKHKLLVNRADSR